VNKVQVTDGVIEIEAQKDIRADVAEAVIKAGGKLQSLNAESQSLDDIYTRYFEEVNHESLN
jgi:ABC-2 type transport system ATP-binding protein